MTIKDTNDETDRQMTALNEEPEFDLLIQSLKTTRHLDWYDGPLLSEAVAPNGETYLWYWCDCDRIHHRWMLVRVDRDDLQRYIDGHIPLDQLIPAGNGEGFVLFVDTDSQLPHKVIRRVRTCNVPHTYRPGENCYRSKDDEIIPA